MSVYYVGVLHSGWLRPSEIRDIRDFWTNCDAILIEEGPQPNISKERLEKEYSQLRDTYNLIARGYSQFESRFASNMRKLRSDSATPLAVFRMSLWRLLFNINKKIYSEADVWDGEIPPLAQPEFPLDGNVQRFVCEAKRKELLDYVNLLQKQTLLDVHIRDSRIDAWIPQQSIKTWGAIFGMRHHLKSTLKRQNFGDSGILLPENEERRLITLLLSLDEKNFIDPLAPMFVRHSFFNIACHLTDNELDKIWKVLQSDAGRSSKNHFYSQIERVKKELIKLRPSLIKIVNRKFEKEFTQVFGISMGELI